MAGGTEWSLTVTNLDPIADEDGEPTILQGPQGIADDGGRTEATLVARKGRATEEAELVDIEDLLDLESESSSQPRTGRLQSGAVEAVDAKAETVAISTLESTKAPGTAIVGRYVVEGVIGEGGMGKVLRVRHLRLGKSFALKQMHASLLSNDELRNQFYREARLASGLSHPNIVSVVDFGEDPEVGAFMVMELVDGEPLSKRIRGDGRLPLRMACEIILQIADALHYIHKEGIIHGDIKPENILLRRASRTDRRRWGVTLLDFGLARVGAAEHGRPDTVGGTPAYMAPERITGSPARPSADIYALGILAYELVTGRVPFRGEYHLVLRQHVEDEPRPVSEALGATVDERLEAWIMKSLAKQPEQRHLDMAAFMFELKTLMDMLGFTSGRGSTRARAKTVEVDDLRLRLAKLAFDQCGIAMAVLRSGGEIQTANRAFARFLMRSAKEGLFGVSVLDPRFIRVHPNLPADLQAIFATGSPVTRTLTLADASGAPVHLLASLEMLEPEHCLLTLLPLA